MLRRSLLSCLCAAGAVIMAACGEGPTAPIVVTPPVDTTKTPTFTVPALTREFRGLWIATVANIDWPSRTGLTTAASQAELTSILDMARGTGINAIVLQVRANGDALYRSTLEPWSRSLTGTQGGDPGWDPLEFAVTEAHARGIELHAWFNPFRAGNLSDSLRMDARHFAKRRPDLARVFCSSLWFEPSASEVHDQAISVIQDVVRRYNVDAVHMDDFFYPYPDSKCPNLDFPDSADYARYKNTGGTLAKNDWRRDNINRFVERLYRDVHAVNATTRVGISPFGIWRPGNPAGITGLDAYNDIYADSRLWLQRGWVDYFAPQLYWSLSSTGQNFTALLDWWTAQNTLRRHLWPGLAAYRVQDGTSSAYGASEIVNEVQLARTRAAVSGGPTGTILYNTSTLKANRDNLATLLANGAFTNSALVPATPWLDAQLPSAPTISVVPLSSQPVLRVTIAGDGGKPLSWWAVRWRNGVSWTLRTVPFDTRVFDVPNTVFGLASDAIVVQAVDRVGNVSEAAIWRTP